MKVWERSTVTVGGAGGLSRRGLLRRAARAAVAAAGAAIGFPSLVRATALGRGGARPASDRITIGCIGTGGRAQQVLRGFGGGQSQVVALCDVYKPALEQTRLGTSGKNRPLPDVATYGDFRELLARDDIDAVIVATPDHWHAAITTMACRAGKDVYCEKPLAHTIAQGRAMVDAARRYGRVVTGGSQRVRGDYGKIADYVASGLIGQVREAYVGAGGPAEDRPVAGEPVPDGLNWEMFVGPAPAQPFSMARFREWRHYSAFGGGGLDDWGAHFFGGVLYALGLDHTGPVEIEPPDKAHRRDVIFHFANGVVVHKDGPLRFIGSKGQAPPFVMLPPSPRLRQYAAGNDIAPDFLHCVRTRQKPFQDVEYAHRTATMCHLSRISALLGRPLRWDPDREVFPGDEEANRLLDVAAREPWRI
jgi:predicted dehydrogenase